MEKTYSRGELIADRWIHIIGIALALIGLPWLLYMKLDTNSVPALVSLPLYAIGVLMMLTCSMLYNASWKTETKLFLRRFDHAGILVMIAGTYSPFTLIKIGGPWGIGLFATVWGLAIVGVIMALTLPRLAERAMVVLCLAMGWSVMVAIKPLFDSVSLTVFALITAGGILYTAGVWFFLSHWLRYHNAIWHAFVVTAAAVHFFAVLWALEMPGSI